MPAILTGLWAFLKPYLPQIGIALALLGAIVWLEHDGARRAEAAAEIREQKAEKAAEARTAAIEKKLDDGMARIDANTNARIAAIDNTQRTIVQPILTREIMSAPRFTDPAAGITDGMRSALNQARAASAATPAAVGAGAGGVSASAADPR